MKPPNVHHDGAARWIDISVPVRASMPLYPGDPPVRNELVMTLAGGSLANVTRLDMGAHTGTHIDAPVHFIDGAAGAEAIPLDVLMGPAWVADATAVQGVIDAAALDQVDIPDGETRLLLKTTNSRLWEDDSFSPDYVSLAEDAAHALVRRGIRLVGIDYLSIAPFGDPVPTHIALLHAGVVILEGLDLRAVEPGPYELACLPLRIVGCDGGPARAALRTRA